MLEAIRNRSSGIVIKGLLTLLILSFALWGIADVFNPKGASTTVATVGKAEIPPEQVRRDFQREIERLSAMLGTRIDTEQARALGITDGVLSRIIDRTLFGLAASDQGIVVSDDLVRRDIRGVNEFKNAKGDFERTRFQQTLQANGLSETGYIALTRGDIVRGQYLSMIGSAPKAPKRMTEILYAYQNEKRAAEIVTIPYSTVTVLAKPDDAQLAEFHTANAARFTAPESRNLTYVSLTAGELAKEISISDDEIATAYAARLDEFQTPESRVLKQIRLGDEGTAKKASDMLKGGADFATVAKDLADMTPDQLDLGTMTRAQLPPELADAAFAMQPGDFSEPLKSVLGWHILSLVDIKPKTQRSLEDAKKDISREIAADKAINSLFRVANKLEDELGGGATLEEAAKTLSLPIKNIPAIDRGGMNGDARVKDLPKGDFLDVAFNTIEGQDSPLSEAGSDGYFILRVDSVTLPQLRPLASIRADVVKAWQDERQAENAKKLAEDMIAKVKGGGELETLAAALGLKVDVSAPFTRRESVKGLSPALIADLFTASVGDAAEATGNNAHVVARLTNVVSANLIVDKKKLDTMGQQLTSSMRADLLGQLADGLRQHYPVSINSAALDGLF